MAAEIIGAWRAAKGALKNNPDRYVCEYIEYFAIC
jgi:hypothetical protein